MVYLNCIIYRKGDGLPSLFYGEMKRRKIMFIHLNVKSCYTLMNSIIKVDNLLDKTSRMKSESVAITDINTMHTFFDFEQHALKKIRNVKMLNVMLSNLSLALLSWSSLPLQMSFQSDSSCKGQHGLSESDSAFNDC